LSDNLEVRCVKKSGRDNSFERILAIGGVKPDGETWTMPEDVAIDGMKNGRYRFYINKGGRSIEVIIAKSQHGHEYLKTHEDGEEPRNLLRLPDCP